MTRILLDMDGVLVDFVKGALDLHGLQDPWTKEENLGEWDICSLVGMKPKDFWAPLGKEFWTKLDWTPQGEEILDYLERLFGPGSICLLTSPPLTSGSAQGKINWISEEAPLYRRRFLVGPAKEFCAGPDSILVDDSEANVAKFKKAGGKAVLVPARWNRLYCFDPLQEVMDRLKIK